MSSAQRLAACGRWGTGGPLGGCEISYRSITEFLDFARLAIITLISRWVHVPCITMIESEGFRGI